MQSAGKAIFCLENHTCRLLGCFWVVNSVHDLVRLLRFLTGITFLNSNDLTHRFPPSSAGKESPCSPSRTTNLPHFYLSEPPLSLSAAMSRTQLQPSETPHSTNLSSGIYLPQANLPRPLPCIVSWPPCLPSRHGEVSLDKIIWGDDHGEQSALLTWSPNACPHGLPLKQSSHGRWEDKHVTRALFAHRDVSPRSASEMAQTQNKLPVCCILLQIPARPSPLSWQYLYSLMKRNGRNDGPAFRRHPPKSLFKQELFSCPCHWQQQQNPWNYPLLAEWLANGGWTQPEGAGSGLLHSSPALGLSKKPPEGLFTNTTRSSNSTNSETLKCCLTSFQSSAKFLMIYCLQFF